MNLATGLPRLPRAKVAADTLPAGVAKMRSVICRRCLVSGRVQGVYYRGSAAQRARELGVRGHARNLADGRVEVLACGAPQAVERFIGWLWTGSSASRVTAVSVEDLQLEGDRIPDGFETF